MPAPKPPRRDPEELEREVQRLRQLVDQAQRHIQRLEQDKQNLKQTIERLQKELEAARRSAKPSAAPFSRGQPKAHPKTPGRKSGAGYGQHHHRPHPAQVDERIQVHLPDPCPHCGGPVELQRVASQYQEEIVRRTVTREFHVAIGKCRCCQRRVQGRHPLQTSDALGAAAVPMGP